MLGGACSSSNGSGGGGSVDLGVCNQACEQGVTQGCYPPGTCATECAEIGQRYGKCGAEVNALFQCQVSGGGTLLCAPGVPTQLSGCEAEQKALSVCGACTTVSNDDFCDLCRKPSCCAELQAFGTAPDLKDFQSCLQGCSTQSCLDGCETSFPVAAGAFKKVDACSTTQCPAACHGDSTLPGGPNDQVAQYCTKTDGCGMSRDQCVKALGGQSGPPSACSEAYWNGFACIASTGFTCENGSVRSEECEKPITECLAGTGGGGVIVDGGGGLVDGGGGVIVDGGGGFVDGGP